MCAPVGNILVICDNSCENGKLQNFVHELNENINNVIMASDIEEAMLLLDNNVKCAVVDWNLENDPSREATSLMLENIKAHNASLPVFVILSDERNEIIGRDVLALIDGFFWLDDNIPELALEVARAMERNNKGKSSSAFMPNAGERIQYGNYNNPASAARATAV